MKKRNKKPAQGAIPSADVLFEIGTEELPAAYLPGLIQQVAVEAGALFQAQHIAVGSVQSFGAPRRLVLIARGVAAVQRKPGEEIRGPSKQAAYGADGKPTPALEGFLRSRGATLQQVKLVASEKGEYVYVLKPPTQTPTAQALPGLLAQLIAKLRAPKTMRWDASGARFARPVRWLLALYGGKPLLCTYGGLKSSPNTWVGLPLRPRRLAVRSVESYLRGLKAAGVILDQAQRRTAIERMVARVAAKAKGKPAPEMVSFGLLDEVTHLVEQPAPLTGAFDPKYLALPREVLLASMAKHQRVFALDAAGRLAPKCVAILEGKPGDPTGVRMVVERILNARLADSFFFWEEDRRRSMAHLIEGLTGVTFHEKLGTMAQKAERLGRLAEALTQVWQLNEEERGHLARAGRLAKADLVTSMVREFPTLQGIMGKHYAKAAGEPEPVAQAIEEHYLPLAGKAPKTLIGSALAVLDKYDTLASYFSVGIEPSGDQDPFGLRRAAQGIVEVAWLIRRSLPLSALHRAWAETASVATEHVEKARPRIERYILERLYTFAWPAPVPGTDYIDAVLAGPCDDVPDAMQRIVTLHRMACDPGLRKAAKVIERTRNMLKGADRNDGGVRADLLQEEPERVLWQAYEQHKGRVEQLAVQRNYDEATAAFGEAFDEPLHAFFDKVLVNAPDEALRRNRLALIREIHTLYTARIADLSKLTSLQHEGRG